MQKRVGKYLIVQELGKGQFGSVYKALDTENNNKEYAIKLVARDKVESNALITKLFRSEIAIMRTTEHPNLLSLVDYLETSSNYYVVVQYCKDGDLEKYLEKHKKIDEPEAVFYLKQIMSGFLFLHQKKIMHRDFKLANIFLDGKQIIIGDFGFAKAGVDVATTKLGTPYNMSPEIIFSNGRTPYTSKADLWSIGVVYFQMLFGRLPFKALTMDELKTEIKLRSGENLVFPPNIQVSNESKSLLRELLEFDPISRMSWKKFFNHPLFDKFTEYAPAKGILSSQLNLNQSLHNMVPSNKTKPPGVTNTPIDVRDSTLNDVIQSNFAEERKAVNQNVEFSTNFDIPNPIQLDTLNGNMGDANSNVTFGKASKVLNDECNNFFTHERNKYLLILQTSKRVKELLKVPEFTEKFGHILMLSLSLCKRGLLMIDFLTRTLQNKVDIFKIDGFNEFCGTPLCDKMLQAFGEDRKTTATYLQHLEAKVTDPMMNKMDKATIASIQSPTANESFLDVANEKFLVHLLNWFKVAKTTLRADISRAFQLTCVYVHYTLNLTQEFPLYKANAVFNWKKFFENVEALDESAIAQIIYKYFNRKDEVGR